MEMLVIMRCTLRRSVRRMLLLDCGIRRTRFGESPHEDEAPGDVRRTDVVPALELGGGLADERLEPAAERTEAREANGEAHLGHREIRRPQEILRALDASL